jgi:D-alanyl-D-alanine carboxypeptidase
MSRFSKLLKFNAPSRTLRSLLMGLATLTLQACGGDVDKVISNAAFGATLQAEIERVLRTQPLLPSVIASVENPATKVSWAGAVGVADRATKLAVQPSTPFRAGSLTKTFTSAAVHRLADLNQLKLDDAIGVHLLPATAATLRERGYDPTKITVAHLLAHTSGIPGYLGEDYYTEGFTNPGRRWTRQEQMLFALDRFPKAGEPGQTFDYSDTGYNLLGEVIEVKTGLALGAALRDLLNFTQLGLLSTWMEISENDRVPKSAWARSYSELGFDALTIDASVDLFGGGGLVTTVGDVSLFLQALFEGRVVSASSLASMLTSAELKIAGRGLNQLSGSKVVCWGHNSAWGSSVYHCPETKVTVAVTINFIPTLNFAGARDPGLSSDVLAARLIDLSSP